MAGPFDYPTVQWARKLGGLVQNLGGLTPPDLRKLANFLEKLADFQAEQGQLSPAQLQVILQSLHVRAALQKMEPHKGGVWVEFTGNGYEYERFLIRDDGKVPNNRYETKKVS
jgi:hypothetical protein